MKLECKKCRNKLNFELYRDIDEYFEISKENEITYDVECKHCNECNYIVFGITGVYLE